LLTACDRLLVLAALGGTLWTTAACSRLGAAGAPLPGGEAAVVSGPLEDVFLLTGELRAVRSDELGVPRTETGQVQITWMAEDGAEVKQGDRVLEFEGTSVQAQLEERRNRLKQAEIERESRERALEAEREQKMAAVDKAVVEADKARIDAAVPKELRSTLDWRKMQAALKEKEAALEKARLDLQSFQVSSRADLEALRAAEEKARRAAETADRVLQATSVHAPRGGIFIVAQHWRGNEERKLQAGDNVFQGMPVASLPDVTEMEVAATLSPVDHGRIAAGMKARVVLDSWPDRVFEGRIEEVGAVAPEGRFRSVGFPVRVSLARTDAGLMRPGLSARVEVVRRQWERVLLVPRQAVLFEGEKALVRRPGRAEPAEVTLAGCGPAACAVESGLAEGDRVGAF
jgi:HlyD family secretion protein